MRGNRGFALPLSLTVLLILLVVSIWANREVLLDLWATVAQKRAAEDFYAAEAGARWAVAHILYTSAVDSLDDTNPETETTVSVPTAKGTVSVDVVVRFLGLTTDCGFRARCCRRFEIRAQVEDGGPVVKIVGFKSIPNPEQDENARRVCVM